METAEYLYVGNDHDITITGATAGGSPLTTATVTYVLADLNGTVIASGPLSHTGGGNYLAVLESSQFASLVLSTVVRLTITLVQGGYDAKWSRRLRVANRPFS